MPATRDLGILGEELACDFLKKNGYQILTQNFRSKFGEIDIVALDPSASSEQVLVFVEVKTRWNKSFGSPEEAITPWKIRSIIKTGQYFKLLHSQTPELLRLDAVVIEMNKEGKVSRMEIIKNLTS